MNPLTFAGGPESENNPLLIQYYPRVLPETPTADAADQQRIHFERVGTQHVWGEICLDVDNRCPPDPALFRISAGQFPVAVVMPAPTADTLTQWLNAGADRVVIDVDELDNAETSLVDLLADSGVPGERIVLRTRLAIETLANHPAIEQWAACGVRRIWVDREPLEQCSGDLDARFAGQAEASKVEILEPLGLDWLSSFGEGQCGENAAADADVEADVEATVGRRVSEAVLDRIRSPQHGLVLTVNFAESAGADLAQQAGQERGLEVAASRVADGHATLLTHLLYGSLRNSGGLGSEASEGSDDGTCLVPTVVCDPQGIALGLAYSNRASLYEALRQRRGVYWSRSRNALWIKGDTSGDIQMLDSIDVDCDRDSLRFRVRQKGNGFCHLRTRTCFGVPEANLANLERTIVERLNNPPAGSYTARLLGDPELLRAKLREEADEACAAQTQDEVIWESADVLYFLLVLARQQGVGLQQIVAELNRRDAKVTRRAGDAKVAYLKNAGSLDS